jgi:hypothetical protein
MKSITTYLLNLSGFLLLAIALQSCTDKAGSWKNEQIKAGKRDDFHDLNARALQFLKANNPKALKAMLSKELIDDDAGTTTIVDRISNHLNDHSYEMLDEYYVVNKSKEEDTIKASSKGINDYSLIYPGTTHEMYFAFFIPKAGENKYLISITYCNYDYGWKISKLDMGPYTINGKTAPGLFGLAKEQYDKKYLIDAVNNAALVSSCLEPNGMWHYQMENLADSFYTKVLTEANNKYKFPFTLYSVHTRPQIIRVYNQTTPDGTYPMIYYLSDINLKDTVAIKNENAQIKKVIGLAMPGIDKEKKYIFYDAFNERPTGRKSVAHFDMIDKLK